MVVKEFFHLPVFLILLVLFHSVNTQYHRDSRENSFSGGAIGDVCLRESYRDVRCQSFNYVFIQEKCELSNRIKEARPEDFVPNSEVLLQTRYVERWALRQNDSANCLKGEDIAFFSVLSRFLIF